MKNLLYLSMITLLIAACSPKTANKLSANQKLANTAFQVMVDAQNSGNIDKMLDFTFPKLFDMMPRDQQKMQYDQMAMMGMKSLLKDATISNMTKFVSSGDASYAKANISAINTIELADMSLADMLMQQMAPIYGADKMTKTDKGIDIQVNDPMYIMKDASNKIYFLQAGAQVAPMLGQLIPSDVIEKLAEKK